MRVSLRDVGGNPQHCVRIVQGNTDLPVRLDSDPALTFVMLINFVFFAFFCGGVQPHMPLVYKMFASAKTVVPGLTVRQLFAFFTF